MRERFVDEMSCTKSKELRFSKILPPFYPRFGGKAAFFFFKEQRNVKLFVVRTNAQRKFRSLTPLLCQQQKRRGGKYNTDKH